MKILIQYSSGASTFIRAGWSRVLQSCGHAVIMWNKDIENINDLESRIGKIDVFLGNTYDIDRSMDKWIRRNPYMKIALFGSNWGELTNAMDKQKYPIVRVTEEEKLILGKLYNDIKKPDLIHIHITDTYLEPCMGGWKNLGIPICGILNGADTFVYLLPKREDKYICSAGLISGYWPYKAVNLDKYIVRLCYEEIYNLNIKVFGYGWNIPQYLGFLGEGEDAKAMASSYISPTISESHSYIFPDITERTFKTPLTGSLCISDNVDLTEVFEKKTIPQFKTYKEFKDLIYHYILNKEDYNNLTKKQFAEVLSKHTYFDRMFKLFDNLGLRAEADKIIAKKNSLFQLDSK